MFKPIFASAIACAVVTLSASAGHANDGRDRYQLLYTNLFYHLDGPVAAGAGFRVLPEDMPGGADGDPSYRWAQNHAAAVVEIAAYNTVKALGPGKFNMAIFDLSSENGDTPVDFGLPPSAGALPAAPRGRHPGGSHDGGLNLDLGYYLTRLEGKVEAKDYAACTEHYHATEKNRDGKPRDLAMCVGPADRLDVGRQAYFFLELLKLHRDRFKGELLDEVGVDRAVLEAVRNRLLAWRKRGRHGIKPRHLAELDAIFTHDRWGGWQRYHHHHTHLRIQNFNTTGPLRSIVRGVEREARQNRARLRAGANKSWPAALDAQLLTYRMQRAVEVHVLALGEGKRKRVTKVRYRFDGGSWKQPDDPRDDYRYVYDLPVELRGVERMVKVDSEVTTAAGKSSIVSVEVMLPRQDPRLHVGYKPGDITGRATLKGAEIKLRVAYPAPLRALVTRVHYRIYPAGGGEPELHVVDAAWFADAHPQQPANGSRQRSAHRCLPLTITRKAAAPPIGLIEAQLFLSSRAGITIPLYIGATK